jgi:hypothetical protein
MLIDVFGLSEEIGGMRNMFEARGRDGADAWAASDRGARTVDILEITSALAGITHGAVDFTVDYLQDLQIAAAYMGSEDIGTCEEKIQMIADIQYAQACQAAALDHMFMGLMSVEETDAVYQAYRSATVTGLEVASLVAGGYGVAKGVIGASRLVGMPAQIGRAAKMGNSLRWPSASNGRSLINGIEYTTHALERMSPRGLIQNGTEIVSRGVPPLVVENAISFGSKSVGKTSQELVHTFENVRVVTNSDSTRVITVITTGR